MMGMDHLASEAASAPIGQAAVPMLDLQPFCSVDRTRHYLMKPFSRDGFTWATNGHILVRVPLRAEIPDSDKQFNQARVLIGLDQATLWARLEGKLPPEVPSEPCDLCDGSGKDIDDENYGCVICDGKGRQNGELEMSITLDRAPFSLNYVRQLAALLNVEIAVGSVDNNDFAGRPLLFRFDGGVGALMPLRSNRQKHISFLPRHNAHVA